MKKRIGSLLMALVLALSLVPATVWAADDPISVDTFEELQAAIASDADTIDIVVTNDIELTQELTISGSKKDITIRSQEGSTHKLLRSASFQPSADDYKSEYAFRLKAGKLTFQNIILDGNKEAVTAKNTFVFVSGSNDTQLTLGQGATIQNCASTGYGGAVYVSTGKLVMEEGSAIKDCTTSYRGGAIAMIYEPWSNYSTGAITFTMKGATISGCSTTGSANYAQGGAIFTSGRVTMDIQGSTIESNTANGNGGAIYGASTNHSGDIVLNLSGTTITGNTSTELGGGVYFAGTTFTVSGATDITGNTGKGSSNNVYLAAGKTVSGSGLQEGSKVGISGANIPSTLVTGYDDDSENGYFTADRTETKLKATTGGLELVGKEDHTHCICGRTDCQETGTGHRKITCKGVSSLDMVKTKGSYYLLNDVTLTKTWKAPSGITLCLNGFSIQGAAHTAALTLSTYDSIFNLTDCGSTGKVTSTPYGSEGNRHDSSGVVVAKDVTFNLYNGSICDLSLDAYQNDLLAGAVEVNGTFNMYSGSIKDNQGDALQPTSTKPYTGGVLVNSTGVFNLYGGEISGNYSSNKEATWPVAYNGGAVYVNGGKFKMTGGFTKNNTAGTSKAASDGGGVYVTTSNNKKGTFTMTGGEISGNTAIRNGGGVAVVNGTFKMSGDAKITGNSAQIDWQDYEHKGGGVFVGAGSTFTMSENASISGNLVRSGYTNSNAQGAGVYVSEGGTFTMNGNASIKSNTMTVQYRSTVATLYGGGVFVGGTLNLSGGAIEDNNAYYEAGGIYVDTKGTANLGTGTVTVKGNTIHNGDFTDNVYLVGNTKLVAENAPAKNTSIGISVPLSRATTGSVVITNAEGSIKANDARFPLDISEIKLERSGDDLKVTLPVHKHGAVTYTPVERLSDIKGEGNYYLVQDSTMTGSLTIAADTTVNICLNGHKNAATNIVNNGTLTITDCKHASTNPGYLTSGSGDAITNNADAKLTLDSMTAREAKGNIVNAKGDSTVILKNSIFAENGGSALYVNGATATVTNCTFEKNGGRAIYADYHYKYDSASITVTGSTFTGNSTMSSNRGGGAIYCTYRGGTTITGCTFTGNSTPKTSGGALLLQGENMRISDCTITGNSAGWQGGGIFLPYGSGYEAPVFSGQVIVEDNTADGVENNVHLDGSETWGVFVYADSNFSTSSRVGISADNIPTLAVKGLKNTAGFFADNRDSYTLRSTTDSNGPHLVSANSDENHTGLELWHRGNDHTHCVCGTGKNTADSSHNKHTKVKWIGVTTLNDLPEGNYYLLENSYYYTGSPWTPVGHSNLCLNGHTYAARVYDYGPCVTIGNGVNASITDCSAEETGKFTHSYSYQGVKVAANATFTLWRGSISKFDAATSSSSPTSSRYGGGVHVAKDGTFTMNGGSITKCTANAGGGGGVYVSGGTFIMNDGIITGNSAKPNHTSTDDIGCGGGVYGKDATITINGGTITGNKATNGGGLYTSSGKLTIDGATINGNTATNAGGGLFLGLPNPIYDARGYRIVGWDTTAIKNATISNNTAVLGGGVYAYGAFRMSDTTITGNTATGFGGGIDSAVDTYTQENWVYALSGKMNITGNKLSEADNNLFLATGKKLPAVTGLTAGSTIGVTTGDKPLKDGGTIAPVYITGDATNKNYFTSDEGYEVKLAADKNQLYIIAESSTVTVTPGKNMTVTSGDLKQTVLKNRSIADVTITAADGCYFPENYGFTQDGITVTRDSLTQITVSGTPTAEEVTLILPAATAKTTPAAPGGLQGVAPSTWEAEDGKISGTKTTMEWAKTPNSETWTPCTEDTTTVGGQGTYYVRVKATDISYTSDAAAVTVPKYLMSIDFPRPGMTNFPYDGNEHTLLVPGKGYTVSGNTKATNAGTYTATVNLDTDRYQWSSTVTDNTISWTISKRAAQATDFTFAAPKNLIWDGHAKAATITLNTPLTLGDCKTSLVYKQGDKEVASPTDPGTYRVYLVITGDGNFAPTDGLTAATWTFTIAHPANHVWGNWQHDDTQHWHNCTVPGCTAEERGNHTTATPATCTAKAVCTVCESQYGEVDAHNHPAAKVTSTAATAPTCGSKGNQAYSYCADCHKYFKDGSNELYDDATHFDIAALTHRSATKTAAVAPTCEEGGNLAYWHCADCGNYYADKDGKLDSTTAYDSNETFRLSALGHDYEGQPYKSDATGHWQVCKHDGCTQETAHQAHSGHEATCVAESKCQVCDYKLADKNPNNHANPTLHDAVAPTCTQPGNDAYWHCADCGKYFADKNGDMDTSKAYDTNASFLKSALGHDFTEKLVDDAHLKSAATCTESAVYYYDCSRCDTHSKDKTFESGKPLGHDFTEKLVDDAHLKSAATCTESAVYYYDCSRCDTRSTADTYSYGDPLGHSYTKYVYNNDATYDTDGTETAHCDHSCGETDTRTKVGSKLIDSVAPVVTGVENDKTYCKQVVVTITDVNSFTVTLNGQSVTLEDGKLTVAGLEEEQTLVATDRFGNSTTVTFTVNTEHISDEGKITKEPTAAVEGEKTFTCTVCGLVLRTEPVAKLAPTIVEGANGKHQTGGNTDLTFRSDASFEDFLSVSVDGKVLDKNQYTLREGSILVTLKADYLSTLSVGQHTLGVNSASGTAETVFTVTAAPAVVPTGDTTGLTQWVSLAALCGLGTLVVVSRKKRENG